MISKELLDELKIILKEEYGENLEPQEVSNAGNTLVNYFNLLAKFNGKDKNKNEKQDFPKRD